MKTKQERLKEWASKLDESQLRSALVDMTEQLITFEEVSFWDDSIAPYWSNTGEPLVEGQSCYPDDEE